MKKIISIVLSIIMIVSLIPISAIPSTALTAGEIETPFTVEVSNNNFTIRRASTGSRQTVAYRTVSVTAVEGIHFTPAVGTVTFEANESSKTVTVTETNADDIPVRYRFQSGRYREYRFEVLDGSGYLLASANRQIDYGDSHKFNNAQINSNVTDLIPAYGGSGTSIYGDILFTGFNSNNTQIKDSGYEQRVYNVSTANIFTLPGLAPKAYLSAIGVKLYTAVKISVSEENDGYQYIQILADNGQTFDGNDPRGDVDTPSISYYKACFERDVGSSANSTPTNINFPHRYDYKNRAEELQAGVDRAQFVTDDCYLWAQKYRDNSVKAPNAGAILLDPMTQEVNFRFDAAGKDDDTWNVTDIRVRFAFGDEFPPYPTDNIYVSGGPSYKKYSPVTITVCFNEIVVPSNNCVLKTTWGNFPVVSTNGYANVLSFSGAINANAGTQLRITGIEGTVSDLFGRNMEVGLSRTFSYTVGQSPSLTVQNGYYLIRDAAELYAYADMLESYPNRSGRLMNDIDMINSDVAGFKAMGSANGFTGTFDGNGHAIYNLNNVSADANGFCGLFGFISAGGRVQDLDLEISFTAPLGNSGAICGFNLGTVDKCTVSGRIYNSVADSAQSSASNRFGGVVGDNRGNVLHCLALNELTNRWQNLTVGGIVGYNSGTVESCCFSGVFSSNNSVTRGAVCGQNASSGTLINCAARNNNSNYYSDAVGTNNGTVTNTFYMSGSDFASGKACYEVLNNGVCDGTQFWYQNIDNGQIHYDYPQFSGGTVYKHGNTYTNTFVHNLSYVNAVAPRCETVGYAEHWRCTVDGCGKIFTDENAQNETTLSALEIPALGHNPLTEWSSDGNNHWHRCSRCTAKFDLQPHTFGEPVWEWYSFSYAKATFDCTVCGVTLYSNAPIAATKSGDTVNLTATATFKGNTYTDEKTLSPLTLGGNTVHIETNVGDFYQFVPSEDGEYRFYSVGEYDPRINIYDINGNRIGYNDDYDNQYFNYNFDLTVSLEGGTDYIIVIDTFSNNYYVSVPVTMYIEKADLQYDINNDGDEDINDIGFIISSSLGEVEMNWLEEIRSDLNSDGVVDAFDAAELDRILFSNTAVKGDVNADGEIDIADYAMTKAHISGVAVDNNTPANLLDKSYLTSEYDSIKNNYADGTIITQQYYCADYNSDKAVDAFDLFFIDKRINNIT